MGASNEIRRSFDARPSDAIALAIKAKAPIFISTEVLAEATVPADFEQDEAEAQQFKNFLKDLKASDFNKPESQE